jgi:hypothetical protein
MSRNQHKKEAERRILAAARKAGAPVPSGELEGEEPDFRFRTCSGVIGIELTEVLRPATSNHGILPAEAESFHQSIMSKAEKEFLRDQRLPTRVHVYFSPARGKKQDKQFLIDSLVTCVAQNRLKANPAAVVKHDELPEGFDHVLITAEHGEWWSGEGGGITLSEIREELADKISAKDTMVGRYRENLGEGAQIWLLLFSRPTVARSVPMPHGVEDWKFPFRFDRVFWFGCLENRVVEIQREESPQEASATTR